MSVHQVLARKHYDELPGAAEAASQLARESARLEELDLLDILDTPREEAFDRITRLARKLFDVPIALVSFIDGHRQWYKSCQGLLAEQAPREHTFCRYMLDEGRPLIVEDATADPRFVNNPYVVGEPGIRFYAGVPLRSSNGAIVGSLCIIDLKPREFPAAHADLLNDLGQMSMAELELRLSATKDSVTGAMSRRSFKEDLARAVALALRHHEELAVITFDLDHFKSINDRFGHATGDLVLAQTVKAATRELRETDLVGRLGGEEFAILLSNTNLSGALEVARKVGKAIENLDFGSNAIKATASFGVASLDASTRDANTLLEHADKALYEAKNAGRNRSVAFQPQADAAPTRRRVLKGGHIVFNGGTSSIDCTVKSLSDEGAGIEVSSTVGIPKTFDLVIRADNFRKPARITSHSDKHIELEFLHAA